MAEATENFLARETVAARYRADIDGLRAVAVGAVILYHLGASGFAGGLAGVDVFFVISGFLITGILYGELRAGRFSIKAFYERRIRRIFPALFVVMVASAVMAWLVASPPDAVRFGQSLAASAVFVSNLYFLVTGQGYFTPAAQDAPLLHLWSLAVEEQFYLVFPWMLLAGWVWLRPAHRWWIGLLAAFSLALGLSVGARSASASFYFAGSRFWELMLGALLALTPGVSGSRRWVLETCGLLGMILVVLAISGQAADMLPAGAEPLVPCLGAALIIAGGSRQGGIASAALSFRPLVFVGLISYSLYLWHWPLLVFYRAARPLEAGGEVAVIFAAFLLAAATWRFVEQPARGAPMPQGRVFGLAAVAVLAALALSAIFSLTRGGASRFPARVQWLYSFDSYQAKEAVREGRCFLAPRHVDPERFDREACLASAPGKPDYLLVGDSHAAHLWLGLARALPELNVQQATASGCRPLLYNARAPQCERFLDHVLNDEATVRRPAAVILAGRWSEADIEPLRQTISFLLRSSAKVIVIGPSVEYRLDLPHVLALAERRQHASLIDRARVAGTAELDRLMMSRLAGTGARYVSLYRALCPADGASCVTVTQADGIPVQFDYGHFTKQGSVHVGGQLRDAILTR